MQIQEFSAVELEEFVEQIERDLRRVDQGGFAVESLLALRQACLDEIAYLQREAKRIRRS